MVRVLVVDNYDSFVHTIAGYLEQLGARVSIVRNDVVDVGAVAEHDGVLVSPGPGVPAEAGASLEVIAECARTSTPMLGVCLGHQALGAAFGGTVTHAPELMHGRTSAIEHSGTGVLEGLPSPFTATRYHSLAVVDGTFSDELEVTARAEGGVIMGLAHRTLPLHGVQFHPESVLSEGGHRLFANWLALCGSPDAVPLSASLRPLLPAR